MDEYLREDELIDMASNNNGMIVIECASHFVRVIAYDMITHVCVVSLDYKNKTTTYEYPNMAFEHFVKFVNSESKGVFYNDRVKPKRYPPHQRDSTDGSGT